MQEDEFTKLADEMVKKIEAMSHRYPETFATLEDFQKKISQSMENVHNELAELPEHECSLMTLFIIHEIHKVVDEVFMKTM